jgi:hypothetical protein
MKSLLIGAIALFTTSAMAVEFPMTENIVTQALVDVDKDGVRDDVALSYGSEEDQGLTLSVLLSSTGKVVQVPDLVQNTTATEDSMDMGEGNIITQNASGSLQLKASNEFIGRNRWRETLTIVYRKGQLILAGYTYVTWDTVNGSLNSCDLNTLSGKGIFTYDNDYGTDEDVFGDVELLKKDIKPALSSLSVESLAVDYVSVYCIQNDADAGDFAPAN